MLEAGDSALPMNHLARVAGVGVGTVYRHFPTRQVLLEDLAATSFEALLEHARAGATDPDAGRGLATLIRGAVHVLIDDVGLGAVLRSDHVECTHTGEVLGELLGTFQELLSRARAAGAVRPDITADDLRRHLLGAELAARLTDTGDGPDPQRLDRDIDILITGLRPQS